MPEANRSDPVIDGRAWLENHNFQHRFMSEQSKQKVFTDIHTHGVPRRGVTLDRGWRRVLFSLFARWAGTSGTGPASAASYMEALVRDLRQAKYVRRAVLLALDRAYDGNGAPFPEGAAFAVDNEDVLAWCGSAPDVLLFGASVHPRRHDALDALERCAARGAALVKWLPNAQNIDPADRGYIPYYRKLAQLGLPLLCHGGYEFALPALDQSLGRLERLRLPLEEGVTVIAAHSGSTGIFVNRSAMNNFARMLHRYPNLYGETAALALPNRMGALLWWRRHPELFPRLFFATDFPVPQWVWVWRPFLPAPDYHRLIRETNPFDRMAILLQGLGVYPRRDGFEDLLGRLGRVQVLPTESGAPGNP